MLMSLVSLAMMVRVLMLAAGQYSGMWRLYAVEGDVPVFIGEPLWCVIHAIDPSQEVDFGRMTLRE